MPATVVVEGVEIPESLISEEVQHHPSASPAEARTAAGKALAIRALLLNRAAELNLSPEPQCDEDGREETPEEALVRMALDAEVEIVPPTNAECRRVYDGQQRRFTSPTLLEAAHILIEPVGEGAVAHEVARLRAQALLDDLLQDPAKFGQVARAESACPSGAVGGSLGQLGPGDLVAEVEQALSGLADGELLTQPVRSRFGWHILRLERRIEGRVLPFEYVEESIRLHLESRAWTAAAARYVADLAADAREQGVPLRLTRDGPVRGGSLVLGDFLRSDAKAARIEAWLAAADADLAARLTAAAAGEGIAIGAFARRAATEFVNHADDERWTQLISAAQGAEDAGLAALAQILRSKLAPAKRTYTVFQKRA
jgi:peptidyl-prolyl cis-trans isomerase C